MITAPESDSSLNKLAADILKQYYGITPQTLRIVQSGSVKTVWRVTAGSKQLCLKRLRQTLDKALFSSSAQQYIRKAGGHVPDIYSNSGGSLITEHKGELFALYEWVEGRDLGFGPGDLADAIQGLAKFHLATKGFSPSPESRVSSKLGKWSEQYGSMNQRMTQWLEQAKKNPFNAGLSAYARYTPAILDMADQALELLSASSYSKLTAAGSPDIVLCHQDYGRGNALLTSQGACVLDLDGVTYDLPARDLRKIIGKLAENTGHWDGAAVQHVVDLYSRVNPLNPENLEVLRIDLMYPHWYFGLVKNLFQNGKTLKASEIERMAQLEESKLPVLKNLFRRGGTI